VHVEWSDFHTIGVLVLLEGLLSGDNALVLAVHVLPLPEDEQRKALQYGILGAFVLRIIATLLAVLLAKAQIVMVIGGLYLLYLPYKHFTTPRADENAPPVAPGRILGLSCFWSTVVKADLIDLVFAVDSILAAVGMSKKTWVIIAGGLLGILMMRLLTIQVLELVKKYPKLIDGAYIIVAWVGVKLLLEFLHGVNLTAPIEFVGERYIPHIDPITNVVVVLGLFVVCFFYARLTAARPRSSSGDPPGRA
jgi:YkoY family integral membrane protein